MTQPRRRINLSRPRVAVATAILAALSTSTAMTSIEAAAMTTPQLVAHASAAVTVGGQVRDTATLSGLSATAGGSIDFYLGMQPNPCGGFPVATVPVAGNATYVSPPLTPSVPGNYVFGAEYSGDQDNGGATTSCFDPAQAVIVSAATPQLPTTAALAVPDGDMTNDAVTLSGGYQPTGSLTFSLYGPGDATCSAAVATVTDAVHGNGAYSTAPRLVTSSGVYRWIARYTGDADNRPASGTCAGVGAGAILSGSATPTAPAGSTIADDVTLSATNPTGLISFALYRPDDPACSAPAPWTMWTVPVSGDGSYSPDAFSLGGNLAGTYHWVALYSGDANNSPTTAPCASPSQSSVVTRVPMAMTSTPSPSVPVGQDIWEVINLQGNSYWGSVTLQLFGPTDPGCAATPLTATTKELNGSDVVFPVPYTTTAAGTYRWVATYSGDTNDLPASTACGDPASSVLVTGAPTSLSTASAAATTPVATVVGGPTVDTVNLSGGWAASGHVRFSLFGPDDPTCSGTPLTTSTVAVAGNGAYRSAPYAPNVPGTYNWMAAYSGDANNVPTSTGCGSARVEVVDQPATPVTSSAGPAPSAPGVAVPVPNTGSAGGLSGSAAMLIVLGLALAMPVRWRRRRRT